MLKRAFFVLAILGLWALPALAIVVPPPPPASPVLFFDDMESGTNGWSSTGLWHQVTAPQDPCATVLSGMTSWYYGASNPANEANCDFDFGDNSGSLTSPWIDIPASGTTTLGFWYLYETEAEGTTFDQRFVRIQVSGGGTDTLVQLSGDPMLNWQMETLDLSAYAGETIRIEFFFDTIDFILNEFRGWYIDDVTVVYEQDAGLGGYTDNDGAPFSWYDIAAPANLLGSVSDCDDCGELVPLGFNFFFYGTMYSNVAVSSNGYLTFGADLGDFSNSCQPHTDLFDYIAPFWDDLDPADGGDVYATTLGTAPNRMLVVSYIDTDFFDENGNVNFQVILFEGTNQIKFQYLDMLSVTARGTGLSATIGLAEDQNQFDSYSCNQAVVSDGLAILWTPGTPPDPDGDGLPTWWEQLFGTDPEDPADPPAGEDVDGDGLDWFEEFDNGTNPLMSDSDLDGIDDGDEVGLGSDPLQGNGPQTVITFAGPGQALGTSAFNFDWRAGADVDEAPVAFRVLASGVPGKTILDYVELYDLPVGSTEFLIEQKWLGNIPQVYVRIVPVYSFLGREYLGTPSNEVCASFLFDKSGNSGGDDSSIPQIGPDVPSTSSDGGGCTLGGAASAGITLPLLLLAAGGYLLRRRFDR